jgi:predicted amidohydrolase
MRDFKIAAAQIPSLRGDVAVNVAAHVAAATAAAAHEVSIVVFPELSLTGYEPDVAGALAFTTEDGRLAPLRNLARALRITLVAGAPVRSGSDRPAIGAFVFTPAGELTTYLKMHLGESEAAHFSSGDTPMSLDVEGQRIGLSICADSSHRSHASAYAERGVRTYAAGVFFTEDWYATDAPRLQTFARDFEMLTVMANHGASTGTHQSAGRSAVWAPGGTLLVQADGLEPALVLATSRTGGWQGDIVRL